MLGRRGVEARFGGLGGVRLSSKLAEGGIGGAQPSGMGVALLAEGITLQPHRSDLQGALNYARTEAAVLKTGAKQGDEVLGMPNTPAEYYSSYSQAHEAWSIHDICRQFVRHRSFVLPVSDDVSEDSGELSFPTVTMTIGDNHTNAILSFTDEVAINEYLENDEFNTDRIPNGTILSGAAIATQLITRIDKGVNLALDAGSLSTYAILVMSMLKGRIQGSFQSWAAEAALHSLYLEGRGDSATDVMTATGFEIIEDHLPFRAQAEAIIQPHREEIEEHKLPQVTVAIGHPSFFVVEREGDRKPMGLNDIQTGPSAMAQPPEFFHGAGDAILAYTDPELAIRAVLHGGMLFDDRKMVINRYNGLDFWRMAVSAGKGAVVDSRFYEQPKPDEVSKALGYTTFGGHVGIHVPPDAWWLKYVPMDKLPHIDE